MGMKKYIPFLIVLLLAGCDMPSYNFMGDYRFAVGGGYMLSRSSANNVKVVPESGGYRHVPIIPVKVIKIGFDEQFVIALRQQMNGFDPVPNGLDYWILDTSIPAVYGPLNLEQFNLKRADLKVPSSLSLKDVKEFEPSMWTF